MNIPYSYTILRYVHDTTSGEFANVGVVLIAPEARFAAAQFRKTPGRVSKLFHGMDVIAFRMKMKQLQAIFETRCDEIKDQLPLHGSPKDALTFATAILHKDDSSLQWSPIGGGICADLEATITSLFARYIMKYDDLQAHEGRSDSDIWKEYNRELVTRNVSNRLHSKTIIVPDDHVEFKYAWKNDIWHCLEPVSFDLATEEGIREKAHKMLGRISSIQDSHEAFRVHFLTGAPQHEALQDAYANALSILRKLKEQAVVVKESEFSVSAGHLAEELIAHERPFD